MIMDLSSEKGSGSGSGSDNNSGSKKSCSDCQTSKTPLWRGGPDGPKSLCNACGIRYRKKRRALLGIKKKEGSVETKKKDRSNSHHLQSNDLNNNKKLGASLKLRLLAFGREVLLQRSSMETQLIQLGEEEQAAVLLMALSCGSVSA